MNIHDIYGVLFAGKTIQVPFASKAEADTFRTKLHKYKRRQEQVLLAAELLEAADVTCLSFSLQQEMPEITGHLLIATISFKAMSRVKKYEVVILPDETEE